MARLRLLPLISILTLLLSGCGETPEILAIVKAGKLRSTTKAIGNAFDAAFPGGTWTADMTGMGMGEMYTHFRSSITAEALEASGVPSIDRKNCMDGVKSPSVFRCPLTSHWRRISRP